ncbi:hypothetical protein A2690_00020 [Candidatus Roizmanbacteria bacterium RIFCSPHIGHO2_01_FULL_39_12b]|uniref:Phosphatidic acid phosphatase type 2/haloperoxidase domain-containing protein n=1 Tax=Candidatus Roizmanbacteria bacterium RIFCSPHIGHO2_01_FULL_39_12b TaxID=1802030 RepID=A0A1F7G895_9BACT|nr:MAG: hypothetical protein A2690_00020 [Candidatus Roizmanbacteria bacterium RIFCSPHIGHO2_01_FULL_39_12b]
MKIDLYIFDSIHQFAGIFWPLDWLGILGAKYLPYLLIIAALYFLFRLKTSKEKLFFLSFTALATLLSRGIITEAFRFFYDRPRPFVALGFQPLISQDIAGSFPSGHAAFYFALALCLYLFNKKWGWWFMVLSLFMGLARVFVGVHYPSDILGGMAIAAVSFFVVLKIFSGNVTDETLDKKSLETLEKAA